MTVTVRTTTGAQRFVIVSGTLHLLPGLTSQQSWQVDDPDPTLQLKAPGLCPGSHRQDVGTPL